MPLCPEPPPTNPASVPPGEPVAVPSGEPGPSSRFRALQRGSFLALLVAVTAVFFWMIRAYLLPIFWAIVLAILFEPAQRAALRLTRGRAGAAAGLTLLLVLLVVILPLSLLGIVLVREAVAVYHQIGESGDTFRATVERLDSRMSIREGLARIGVDEERIHSALIGLARTASGFLVERAAAIGKSALTFLAQCFISLYVLFYLLREGKVVVARLIEVLPFGDEREARLFARFASTVRATMKGTVVVGLIQGLLSGVLFAAVGVGAPVLLGALVMLFSVVPALGSTAVWAPVAISLMIGGDLPRGVIVLLVGAVVISSVDNVLRPPLVGRDTKMPDVLVLVSTLGGMAVFGLSGFVLGPIIASFFLAMWRMFEEEHEGDLARQG